jgi:hypothetical protein
MPADMSVAAISWGRRGMMKRLSSILLLILATTVAAAADYRVTRDHGGDMEQYKARWRQIRDSGERVIIDGICNSACTLVLGIVPTKRICATPRASLGFHQAYFDKRWTAGIRVTSLAGTAELMSVYPESVKEWIARHGGLTAEMKKVFNGPELWQIVDPCPEDF